MDYPQLVENLIDNGILKTPLIIEAFGQIKRADFLPEDLKDQAGADMPLPIGWGQTNSQPWTVAFMLELLAPKPGNKVLDVGAGSGWTSALLAACVGEAGKVWALERVPELGEFGKNNISKYNFINRGVVEFLCADGSRGWPKQAPYDRILISAAAQEIPAALKEQLKIGGYLVAPVENSIWLIKREGADNFRAEEFPGFVFVPLVKD